MNLTPTDWPVTKMANEKSPIGVFDSGLGGISVLKVLAENFPNESFVYLGDTARLPYGSKSGETIQQYTEQNLRWLAERESKVLIIACNTASSHFQGDNYQGIPVYNMIAPGSEAALQVSKTKVIGVLGTRATIQSQSYVKKLKELEPEVTVLSQACPMFVPLVEEGWNDDPITNLIVFRYIQSLFNKNSDEQLDTLILGCTHYPFLKNAIQKAVGSAVQLIESGDALSLSLKKDLELGRWQANPETLTEPSTQIHFASTDRSDFFENLARQLLAPLVPHQFSLAHL